MAVGGQAGCPGTKLVTAAGPAPLTGLPGTSFPGASFLGTGLPGTGGEAGAAGAGVCAG